VPTFAYNTSKGAFVNMTRTLAHERAPFGINVNTIALGYFPTKMTAQLDQDATAEMAPMKRGGGAIRVRRVRLHYRPDAGGRRWGHRDLKPDE
jgi:NAD(P)-dependent dehydrogenase (short-subunit alcohol dehydrogenase family)